MSKAARRLGRGLDSLVSVIPRQGEIPNPESADSERGEVKTPAPVVRGKQALNSEATMLPVGSLRGNPYQPRDNISDADIVSLANSLRRSGFIQPISVRPVKKGFQIIAGERRWVAAKSIGLSHVPVLIRAATDAEMIELALIENLQREDLNAMERATAYQRFCEEFDLSAEEVGQRIGEDRSTVLNYIRLLDLSPDLRTMVADGRLAMGHARCLLGVAEEDRRVQLARAVSRNQLSVRALEEIVRRERKRQSGAAVAPRPRGRQRSAHVADMERRFEEQLKTKVVIEEGQRKGTGRIIIEYYTLDDFDRVAEALGIRGA